MNYTSATLLAVGLAQVVFGVYVHFKCKKLIGGLFVVAATAMAVWNIAMGMILSDYSLAAKTITILDRSTWIAGPIILLFIAAYLKALLSEDFWQAAKKDWVLILLSLWTLFLIAATLFGLISQNHGETHIVPGPWMPLLGAFILVSSIYITYLSIYGYRTGEENLRRQFLYTITGLAIGVTGTLVFNIVMPVLGLPSYPAYGGIASFFVVFFIGLGSIGAYVLGITAVTVFMALISISFFLIILLAALAFIVVFLLPAIFARL